MAASAVVVTSAVAEAGAVGRSELEVQCSKFEPRDLNLELTMRQQYEALIDDLKSTHRGNLVSVILYGGAAVRDTNGEDVERNLLIALRKIGPEDLRNAHASIREWVRMGNPVPVYFTVSELENAADVFPIEFRQMEAARQVLYGPDLLADIKLTDENLRHQTEYELRSKLLRLRRKYIPASASVDGLKTLMAESLPSFAAFFRAVLVLYGLNPPVRKREVVALTVEHLKLDGGPFERIFNIRANNLDHEMTEKEANELFGEYMEQIEGVIDAVDALDRR